MRVANISSDRIVLYHEDQAYELPYGELEKSVSGVLYTTVIPRAKQMADYEMIVLNGPGSFTNLRIATLALNTMNVLHNFSRTFYSMSKLDWYDQLFRAGVTGVKRYVVMYIGQRRNMWLVDLEKLRCACGDWQHAVEKISLDSLPKILEKKKGNWCLDTLFAEGGDAVRAQVDVENMYVYKPEHIDHVMLPEGVKLLEPQYLMEANVGGGP